jgi:hypothetical protein
MKEDGMFGQSVLRQVLRKSLILTTPIIVSMLILSLVESPARSATLRQSVGNRFLEHVSQGVAVRYWMANPDQAPAQLQRFRKLLAASAVASLSGETRKRSDVDVFNRDDLGLPQNEESITICHNRARVILGGTNDYRGLLDQEGNLTGWHLSLDRGNTVANEGLLPPVAVGDVTRPSGGDPVVRAVDVRSENGDRGECALYAGSLNYDPFDPFGQANGIGVYLSDPETLANCPGGSDPTCWPVRRAVATSQPSHFLDKEWIDAGVSGDAGLVVWATYSDFALDENAPLGFIAASIYAVRCNADLSECTDPILISGDDPDVQFSDVTIGPDGRTYVTWSEIQGELEQTAQTFIHKLRVAEPGSTEFGPEQVIFVEDLAIPFGGILHANNFRVATYLKHEVVMLGDRPRVFAIWDSCSFRLFDFVCQEPVIKLSHSDDFGESWSEPSALSTEGGNYFPSLAQDGHGRVVAAWFTNRYDPLFHNRQDVELVAFDSNTLDVRESIRVTRESNESEADPLLGGFFIGDYIEVAAHQRTVYVHFNANYRNVTVLGQGLPIPQQDNFLARLQLK